MGSGNTTLALGSARRAIGKFRLPGVTLVVSACCLPTIIRRASQCQAAAVIMVKRPSRNTCGRVIIEEVRKQRGKPAGPTDRQARLGTDHAGGINGSVAV